MLFAISSSLLIVDYLRPHQEHLSLTPPYMVCVQIFLCWLLYAYTALALRENVLKVRNLLAARISREEHPGTLAGGQLVHFPAYVGPSLSVETKYLMSWDFYPSMQCSPRTLSVPSC